LGVNYIVPYFLFERSIDFLLSQSPILSSFTDLAGKVSIVRDLFKIEKFQTENGNTPIQEWSAQSDHDVCEGKPKMFSWYSP
jgi:hypothetical protein